MVGRWLLLDDDGGLPVDEAETVGLVGLVRARVWAFALHFEQRPLILRREQVSVPGPVRLRLRSLYRVVVAGRRVFSFEVHVHSDRSRVVYWIVFIKNWSCSRLVIKTHSHCVFI